MSNGYVTIKPYKVDGNETVLRDATPAKHLAEASGDEFALEVWAGLGSDRPVDPQSEVFFEVGSAVGESTIRRVKEITETKFEKIKASQKVARFKPRKAIDHAANKALGLS